MIIHTVLVVSCLWLGALFVMLPFLSVVGSILASHVMDGGERLPRFAVQARPAVEARLVDADGNVLVTGQDEETLRALVAELSCRGE